MKKIVIIVLVILLSGCFNKTKSDDSIDNSGNPSNSPTATKSPPVNVKQEGNCKLQIDKDFVYIASEGRLKGIEIALGTTRDKIIERLGQPDKIGMDNAEYLNYSNCYFYISNDDRVGVIDVRLEIPVNKVKELLGKPHFEGLSDAGFEEYVLGYEAKEYYLYFKYANKESTTGVLRFKNPKGQ